MHELLAISCWLRQRCRSVDLLLYQDNEVSAHVVVIVDYDVGSFLEYKGREVEHLQLSFRRKELFHQLLRELFLLSQSLDRGMTSDLKWLSARDCRQDVEHGLSLVW